MKKMVLVLLVLFGYGRLAIAHDSWQMVVHLSEPGKLFTLNVNIGRAAIHVSGYNGNDVIVRVETDEAKGREDVDVTTHERNNEVTIEAKRGKAIRLDIKVPQTKGIFKLSSVNGGRIMISDVNGNLELQNKSGGISALNISGSVIASTLSGRVTVSFKKVDPATPMAFSTISGAIDITFPADLKANLKIKSDNSKVFSDFALLGDPAHPEAVRDKKDGAYRLSIDDWIYGRVGGGGPEFLIKNTTGNIHIYKTK
jgi:DUF4097 and DUF4098 domain-containing protein YvlB